MADRALEAAERAGGGVESICHLVAVGAAREALRLINLTQYLAEAIESWMQAPHGDTVTYRYGNAQGIARAAAHINGTSFHTEWVAGLDAYQNKVTGYQPDEG